MPMMFVRYEGEAFAASLAMQIVERGCYRKPILQEGHRLGLRPKQCFLTGGALQFGQR